MSYEAMEVNPAEIARNRRWLSLLAGVGLMGASGGIYLFSSYSAALSEHLDINNTELSLIGAAGNIGQWCGVHLGFAVDRWGPVRCSLGGALAAGFGFLCMGLAVDGVLPGNYLVFALYNFVLAQGCSLTYVSALKQTMANFHKSERGTVNGALVCYFGLSAGVFSLTYAAVFVTYVGNLAVFFYFMAALLMAVLAGSALILRPMHPPAALEEEVPPAPTMLPPERRRLWTILGLTVGLAAYQALVSVIFLFAHDKPAHVAAWALFVLLFLAFPLLWFVVWPRFLATDTEPEEAAVPQTPAKVWEPPQWAASVDRAGLLPDSSPVPHAPQLQYAATDEARQVSQVSTLAAAPRPEMTPAPVPAGPPSFAASVLTVDFALLFVGMGGIIGWATTLLNNLAPLTASLLSVHKDEHWTKEGSDNKHFEQRLGSFVTLVSTANVVGRLTLGYLADRYQHRVPRVAWLATAGTILLFACVLQLVAMDTAALYLVVPITGVGLGAVFSTAPVVLSDIASVEHLAQLWGLLTCGACATTLLFATFLAGHFANDAADDSSFTIHTRKFCLGERCFRYGIAAVCGCCTVGTLALWALTYRRLQHRKRALSPAL